MCPTLCDPLDCSPPGSSVHRVFQARILEWVVISSSRGSSWLRAWTFISWIAGRFLTYFPIIYLYIYVYIERSTHICIYIERNNYRYMCICGLVYIHILLSLNRASLEAMLPHSNKHSQILLSFFYSPVVFIFFIKFIYFFIEWQLLYRTLLFSFKPQHESAIGVHISPPFWTSLPSLSPFHPSRLFEFPEPYSKQT